MTNERVERMKDKTLIKILTVMLVMSIALAIYQSCLIVNLTSNLKLVTKDRDKVVEMYNERNK